MKKAGIKKIKEILLKKRTLVFDHLDKKDKEQVFQFCEKYKDFLNQSKTEREAVLQIVQAAKQKGFVDIDTLLEGGTNNIKKVYKIFLTLNLHYITQIRDSAKNN